MNPTLILGTGTGITCSSAEAILDEEMPDIVSLVECEDERDSEIHVPAGRLENVRSSTQCTVTTMSQDEGIPNTELTRFRVVPEADLENIKLTQRLNKNTMAKTTYNMKTLYEFFDLPEISEARMLSDIPITELSPLLCRFLLSVRKKNGDEYEPSCLRGMISSFDRVLRGLNYEQTIAHGQGFVKVRETLSMKQKMLRSQGKGNLPQKSDALTDEDVEKLWNTGQLGYITPDSILQTLWFYNTVFFGLRNRHDHRDLFWGDINLKTNDNGQEYLEYKKRENKTSGDSRDVRFAPQEIWANSDNPDRCPVKIYKSYSAGRPSDYSEADHPFYLAPHLTL